MRQLALALAASTTLATPTASATYSVLLSNVETGELGGAATSCVGDFDLSAIFGYARNQDHAVAFFTQALFSEPNHDQALTWLNQGQEVANVLATLTDPTFDDYASERQYHFLPSDEDGTTWTGATTLPYAGGRAGSFGPWRYTLAGNILSSENVLTMAEASVHTLDGTLEERLLAALEAGAQNNEGDSRCSPLPGDSAYIEVRTSNGVSRLRHSVTNTGRGNPLALLREAAVPSASSGMPSGSASETIHVSPSPPTSATSTSATDTPSTDTASSPRSLDATSENTGCIVARESNRAGLPFLCAALAVLGGRRARRGLAKRTSSVRNC